MSAAQRQQDRFRALDPVNSVAVEACAGSGKTWLLSSRLLRLLLAGVKPGEILAITYTRKAAREIEARLRGLLAELAAVPDAQALAMLTQRGLSPDEAQSVLPRARGLFESVLHAEPPITITTFHGWFARLLSGAPLESGLAGRTLDEAAAGLLDEAWAGLASDCARAPAGELAQALLWLYAELGAAMTRKLLRAFADRRAEWNVWRQTQGGFDAVLAQQAAAFGVGRNPLETFFSAAREADIAEFAQWLPGSSKAGTEMAEKLLTAPPGIPDARFAAICAALLTKAGEPRSLKPLKAYQAAQGEAGVDRLLRRFGELCEAVGCVVSALQDQRNAMFNRHALTVGAALLAKLEGLKRARRVMDFSDLEAEVDALLGQEGTAAWLQARLDARYRHILLDEFQDTNPLQWRILRGWLDGYGGAGVARPSVFLVGDPKQSIYRFRRAEPKLFAAASEYFASEFGALRIGNAHTFRNAQGIVDLTNAVFADMPGFVAQSAERVDWPAHIEVLPLIAAEEGQTEGAGFDDFIGMRHPLEAARLDVEDVRRAQEAELLATRINEMVGNWRVRGHGSDERDERPARYADVLILTRRKTQLAAYEAALRAAGIPFVSPGQGGLLATLEARDLLAVLHFLADPADNLRLAHTLRIPAFNLSDEDLLAISARPGAWWPNLQGLAMDGAGSALARAANLLSRWMHASAHLPAHDLIDRIFHESDWFARCRAALPSAMWPGVQANLEALLELALNVDAGRYPSLTRFVDELGRLSSSEEEAPDEGLVASAGEGSGRVRIMTIHGAKGLEAPIVWLIDANSPPRNAEGYGVAMDWPADAVTPQHFSLLGKLADAGALRAPLLEAEKLAAEREELNLLYVAITRAEQVLIVSGVEPGKTQNAATPWKRIAAALDGMGAVDGRLGGLPRAEHAPVIEAVSSATVMPRQSVRQVPAIGALRQSKPAGLLENSTGLDWGTALHAWLEASTSGWPLPQVGPEIEQAARRLLDRPGLRRFFDPALYQRAGNETAYVLPDGEQRRIDRWVDDGETIWIIDYKSGRAEDAPLDSYRAQLAGYRAALAQVFAQRQIACLLVFTHGGELALD